MTKFKKAVLGAAAAMALAAPVANASPINVGGVIWDPDSILDFSAFSIAIRQFINPVTGVVSGFGTITTMNGTAQSVFCPGCELTFTYDNFVPISGGLLPTAPGQVIGYSGGNVSVFVDSTPELTNPSDPTTLSLANTSDGNLWLGLSGHNLPPAQGGASLSGTVQGFGGTLTGLSGIGLLDVKNGLAGGLARSNFDTNTRQDGADFTFTNSFTLFFPQNNPLNVAGTGNFFSDSIPEPGSLALLGLGLLGMGGLSASRKRAKA